MQKEILFGTLLFLLACGNPSESPEAEKTASPPALPADKGLANDWTEIELKGNKWVRFQYCDAGIFRMRIDTNEKRMFVFWGQMEDEFQVKELAHNSDGSLNISTIRGGDSTSKFDFTYQQAGEYHVWLIKDYTNDETRKKYLVPTKDGINFPLMKEQCED